MDKTLNVYPRAITRFAPSPNGRLHLGHAYSAILAHDIAVNSGGTFLLRIEDIDGPRSRQSLADEFRRDLDWLGLEWLEVARQSERLASYQQAIDFLRDEDLIYPCTCTRQEMAALPRRVAEDGHAYPGSCRDQCKASGTNCAEPAALRLDIDKALKRVGEIVWTDEHLGSVVADPRDFGDVVLVRKDLPASYHLAVTIDDAADGVTLVTRGQDLLEVTPIHRVLQELLHLPVPHWFHHRLVLDDEGEKLAKRRGSPAIAELRERGEDGRALANQLRDGKFGLELSQKLSI